MIPDTGYQKGEEKKGKAIADPALALFCGPCPQIRLLRRVSKNLLKPSLIYPSYRYPNTSIQLASLCCLITAHRNDWPIPHHHEPFLSNSTDICLCC